MIPLRQAPDEGSFSGRAWPSGGGTYSQPFVEAPGGKTSSGGDVRDVNAFGFVTPQGDPAGRVRSSFAPSPTFKQPENGGMAGGNLTTWLLIGGAILTFGFIFKR